MHKKKFFLRQYSFEDFFHGGIGYSDGEKIMQQNGFVPVEFPRHFDFSLAAKFKRGIYFFKILSGIKDGDTLIFIFPVFAKLHRVLLKFLRFKKSARLICFVADIDGIKDGDKNILVTEMEQLKQYNNFIVHNDAMKLWLQNTLPAKKVAIIEFFDFLAKPFADERQKAKQVVFAGNLAKSIFLEKLYLLEKKSPELSFNLYGAGCTKKMLLQGNVNYRGVFEPYKLPSIIEGNFGLVWDGDSIEEPGGSLGDYMRYISHHKLSLYILGGLPLIVPEIAASAALIKKYKIGVTVSSLYEINEAIDRISAEDYQQMKQNMKPLAKRISTGTQLTSAIAELMEKDEN